MKLPSLNRTILSQSKYLHSHPKNMKIRKSNSKDAETLIEMGNCCSLNALHSGVNMQSLVYSSFIRMYTRVYSLLHYRTIYLGKLPLRHYIALRCPQVLPGMERVYRKFSPQI